MRCAPARLLPQRLLPGRRIVLNIPARDRRALSLLPSSALSRAVPREPVRRPY
ncbi:hypothetical protein azo0249 [Azoarcus olearius]|uniref:Uncharacterized protein n=1 Tax=Azoarcus sp. (strain BH72) TaxID=418699 RepID=A1K211_AZOSB|nr:hypothetical protein azo0249 [Azoarcus olearius]